MTIIPRLSFYIFQSLFFYNLCGMDDNNFMGVQSARKLLENECYKKLQSIISKPCNYINHQDLLEHVVQRPASTNPKIQKERTSFLSFLLWRGADINSVDKYGRTPLHNAIFTGSQEQIALFLKKGADVNCYDRSGKTALGGALYYFSIYHPVMRTVDLDSINLLFQHGKGKIKICKPGCRESMAIIQALQNKEIKEVCVKNPGHGYDFETW